MHSTMNVTGEFIFFWYVTVPTLILVFATALSLSHEIAAWLRKGWESLRAALRGPAPAHGHGPHWAPFRSKT